MFTNARARAARTGSRGRDATLLLALTAALVVSLLPAGIARAQDPNQVTGLTAAQDDGFATLRWTPVDGATDYQIERTPVDDANVPTGSSVIVGVWRPSRQIQSYPPAFADAGFNPGGRFQWRVRARIGTAAQPYSEPVFGTTIPEWGSPLTPGENLRTQWEMTDAAQYTDTANEIAYTEALDAASARMRVVEIGQTVQMRPINMFIFGYPGPLATVEEIRSSPTVAVNCIVHGNEPSSREACLIMARELSFSDDQRVIDLLSDATVLLIPSLNGDGAAANTRGNSTGQDLNRDHSLLRQPETFAFAEMMRDYQPDAAFDGHEFGNSSAGDLPTLLPRHLNVAQSIFDEGMNLMEGWLYEQGSDDGWWYCPYGCQGGGSVGLSEETILRNLLGLKNTIGQLLETRSSGGSTRPDEGNTQNNRRRKTYSAMYTYDEFFDYYLANQPRIQQAIDDAIAFQVSNTGPIVWRGSRPIPAHPAPHPGEAPPPNQSPTGILDPPPCGYRMNSLLYSIPLPDGPSIQERLAAHGIEVIDETTDVFVGMHQPLRGLIPLILDGEAAEPIIPAGIERVACGPAQIDVQPDSLATTMAQNTQRDEELSVANTAGSEGATLTWDIEEAEDDCSLPTGLPWVSAAPADGATAPGDATDVTVTFDSTGIVAPDDREGLLCVSSNDPSTPVVEVPVTMTVEGATGFAYQVTIDDPSEGQEMPSAPYEVQGTASTDDPDVNRSVTLALNGPDPEPETEVATGVGPWSHSVAFDRAAGSYTLIARLYVGGDIRDTDTVRVTVGDVSGMGPRARKQDVRDTLAALGSTGDKQDDDRIRKAIERLDKSLEPKRWAGEDRLDPKQGKKVFDEERLAVKELEKVKSFDVSWAIEELLDIDEELAQTAIDDAEDAIAANLTGDPREIDKANNELLRAIEEMDKAAAARDRGDADQAIDHYRKAWEHAQRAIEHANNA